MTLLVKFTQQLSLAFLVHTWPAIEVGMIYHEPKSLL